MASVGLGWQESRRKILLAKSMLLRFSCTPGCRPFTGSSGGQEPLVEVFASFDSDPSRYGAHNDGQGGPHHGRWAIYCGDFGDEAAGQQLGLDERSDLSGRHASSTIRMGQ
jgi:hypothetical protein